MGGHLPEEPEPKSDRFERHGQQSRRVTVALPADLADLETLCRSSFAVKGPIKLWCNGKVAIGQAEYDLISDGDVVIVEFDNLKMTAEEISAAFSTTSGIDYPKWPLEKPHPKHVEQYTPSKDKMESETTNQHDYPKWPLEKPHTRHVEQYTPSKDKLESETTSGRDFRQWPIEARLPPPPPAQRAQLPFEGQTTAHADYPAHNVHPCHQRLPEPYSPSKAHFDGETTYHRDFVGTPSPRRKFIHLEPIEQS